MPSIAPRTVLEHHVLIVDDHDDIPRRDGPGVGARRLRGRAVVRRRRRLASLQQGFRPCVVLLDLHMPDLGGWAFLERTRLEPNLDDVPVVIVSGDAAERPAVIAAGHDFAMKPFHSATLVAAIEKHCRRHREE